MNGNEFLKKLKPGDTVIVHSSRIFCRSDKITTVQKITPKGFIYVKKTIEKLHNINKLTYKQAVEIMAIIEPQEAK